MVRHGVPPFLECSSRGDKRFSAFHARVGGTDRSIEEIYQGSKVLEDGSTNHNWRTAKGKKARNARECAILYSKLWDKYIEENPELLEVLGRASGLSDIFGQPGHCCQATELWRIRAAYKERQMVKAVEAAKSSKFATVKPPTGFKEDARSSPRFEEKNLPDYSEFDELVDGGILGLAAQLAELNARKAAVEDTIAAVKAQMRAVMEEVSLSELGSYTVRGGDDLTICYIKPKPRESLVRELLVQAGVTLKQIQRGTKTTALDPYVTVRVRKAKRNGEDEEED